MGSSELSDALNPYYTQSRNQTSSLQPVTQSPQLHVTLPENQCHQQSPVTRARPSPGGLQAVQELLRIVSATREAQETERERRIAWEKEQEVKQSQRQAELERQVLELKQEVLFLRQTVNSHSTSPTPATRSQPSHLSTPISPTGHINNTNFQPIFMQGSSSRPLQQASPPYLNDHGDQLTINQHHSPGMRERTSSLSVTPAPSPGLNGSTGPSTQTTSRRTPPAKLKKRRRSVSSSSSSDHHRDSDSDSSYTRAPKRRSHHDKRCLTVHHAMRLHIIRLMGLESDKNLPDSHPEGQTLDPIDPVRFVWDKTTKQSVHNARMKTRIMEDLKENRRRLYKHVPDRDFSKKNLESTFDQCFTTLRQKYKAQKDDALAEYQRLRDTTKALKARRLARRKAKLDSRASARLRVSAFEHPIFDHAFELECMSSEESDVDPDSSQSKHLVTRGLAWRSRRLVKFYQALDTEDKISGASAKQKRGVGKYDRAAGAPKEGFQLPPKGVAMWMVSQNWLIESQVDRPDLPQVLQKLVEDSPDFDWQTLGELGEASDEEQHVNPTLPVQLPPQHYEGSSLQYAFVQ